MHLEPHHHSNSTIHAKQFITVYVLVVRSGGTVSPTPEDNEIRSLNADKIYLHLRSLHSANSRKVIASFCSSDLLPRKT